MRAKADAATQTEHSPCFSVQVQEQEDDQPTSSQGPDNSDDDYQEQEDLKHRGHQTRKHLPSLERLAAKVHATKVRIEIYSSFLSIVDENVDVD